MRTCYDVPRRWIPASPVCSRIVKLERGAVHVDAHQSDTCMSMDAPLRPDLFDSRATHFTSVYLNVQLPLSVVLYRRLADYSAFYEAAKGFATRYA